MSTKIINFCCFSIILNSCFSICISQITEIERTNKWYFGEGIGIDYSSGTPVLDTLSSMSQHEPGAVMNDIAGNLLFYTDGDTIWNRNHQMMANGFDVGCESSSNGAVIVPNPGNDSIYYLFTVDCWENAGLNGLRYTIIDINANGGTGAVLQKNLQLYSPSSEQLAVTRHCNGEDYWVVSHAYSDNKFYSHKVTASGVDVIPVITSIGDSLPAYSPFGNAGGMRFSMNGEKLCFVNVKTGSKLFDFNTITGELNNLIILSNDSQEYDCAFSPDNSKLYVTFSGLPNPIGRYISQYDLSSNDSSLITSSKNIIYWTSYANPFILGLQNTRTGVIKVALYYRDSIGVILNPNVYGPACNYQTFPLTFNGRRCKEQFPNFNTNYYNPHPYICSNNIPQTEQFNVQYFPNPASDKLILSNLKGGFESLNIYSIDGRIVLFKSLSSRNDDEIDISPLASGIYIVQLIQHKHFKSEWIKFIKLNF